MPEYISNLDGTVDHVLGVEEEGAKGEQEEEEEEID